MEAVSRLMDLPQIQPLLLWDTIIPATAVVLGAGKRTPPFLLLLTVQNVPGFGSGEIRLLIDPGEIREDLIAQLRRTYDSSRLVELAAIAVTALGLHHAGGHEIVDIAIRGSAADYLVDVTRHHLEIAGRSRRGDFETAWEQRRKRLSVHVGGGYYISVIEFETPSGRLAFVE